MQALATRRRLRHTGTQEASIGWLMNIYESHSFIVKVWLEESSEEAGGAIWRGHVTHVFSQEKRYLRTLDDIIDFIGLFLERLGVKPNGLRRDASRRTPTYLD